MEGGGVTDVTVSKSVALFSSTTGLNTGNAGSFGDRCRTKTLTLDRHLLLLDENVPNRIGRRTRRGGGGGQQAHTHQPLPQPDAPEPKKTRTVRTPIHKVSAPRSTTALDHNGRQCLCSKVGRFIDRLTPPDQTRRGFCVSWRRLRCLFRARERWPLQG